jgi:hypothetical protein
MPMPENVRLEAEAHLDRYVVDLVPPHARDKVRIGYVAKGMAITLFEQRPHWKEPSIWAQSDVVRVRYNKSSGVWTLYFRDQHGKWHVYDPLPPTPDFVKILREIESDPTGIFWG